MINFYWALIYFQKVSETDDTFYCGTTSGDIMQIGSSNAQFRAIGPEKNKISLGVSSIQCLKNGDLLVGCGDGRLLLLALPTFKIKK